MGVFATRSPFRPNPIGLSCVRLIEVYRDAQTGGVSLIVSGADLMNGTPIYDIKPYLPYADCKPDALAALRTRYAGMSLPSFSRKSCLAWFPPKSRLP